ncbi:hypothetical protein AABB87_11260 [Roseateles sp. PN1]
MPNRQFRAFSAKSARSALAVSVALLLGMGPSLAWAEITPLVWSEAGVFEAKLPVAAGKFAEVCGPVAEGQRIAWQFESDQALDFNIHFHLGKQVSYPERQKQVQRAQGELTVSAPQDHCWMWSNKGSSAGTLTLRLKRL